MADQPLSIKLDATEHIKDIVRRLGLPVDVTQRDSVTGNPGNWTLRMNNTGNNSEDFTELFQAILKLWDRIPADERERLWPLPKTK